MSDQKPQEHVATPREIVERGWTLAKRALRFWPVFVGTFLVALAAAIIVPSLVPPVYVSKTTLIYRELVQTTSLLGRDAPVESRVQRGTRLREMLMSRSTAEDIIKEMKLLPDIVESLGMIEAIEEYRKRAKCVVGDDTFAITFEGNDPDTVFAVTKRIGTALIEQSKTYRLEQAESTRSFLVAQQKSTEKELQDKEGALAGFLTVHPEFAADLLQPGGGQTAGATIRAQERKAQGLDPAVEAIRRQRARLVGRLTAPDEPAATAVAPQMDPELASALAAAERDAQRAQANLEAAQGRYTDQHPDVQAAKRSVATTAAALAAAREAAEASVPAAARPIKVTPVNREQLEAQLSQVNENLSKIKRERDKGTAEEEASRSSNWIVELESQWAGLNRDVAEVRERYQQIQRRLFQATIIAKVEMSGGAAQMLVIDPAYKPDRPSRRGSRRVGALAAFVVLLLGAFIALLLAWLDDRMYSLSDVQRLDLDGLSHVVPSAGKGVARG